VSGIGISVDDGVFAEYGFCKRRRLDGRGRSRLDYLRRGGRREGS